ncbi:MAG: very short patch repair endonuclease [Candidatus Parvarchaeota archaeon]
MDRISVDQRTKIMSRIRSTNTRVEIVLRRTLWKEGLRYRIYYGEEKIDIAFPKDMVAVFADGCFWHSCPIHGHTPKSNTSYWGKKLAKNKERAVAKDLRLKESGWKTIHFWEHEISENPEKCVTEIRELLAERRTR